ncbi:MAG: hypothetical protein JRN11_01575 [Nitrososphaerota archaeon]|nr:hypothetical protein [Nitrososphaerota archaeon]MDG7014079.1 hypothetical protein [Nitrososphaerota archaeon]MDG7025421.1 hypothetical protein [Nitrososphaerota archaeon]
MNLSSNEDQLKLNKASNDLREEVKAVNRALSSFDDVLERGRIIDHNEWRREAKFEARGMANARQPGPE